MITQITCPNCGTPYRAEVHQLVDARRTPELKQQLLNGALNVAVCPNCGAGGQMSSILAYHDADHELFMIYLPQELHLNQVQREQMIGRMTQDVTNSLPPEERRAYILQPQMIINMQTFMEKVLETEGITKEMIERQQKQVELLRTLAQADQDVQDYLLKERINEIDETFFAMLQSFVDAAAQANDEKQMVALTNLRARLMMETAVGRRLEQRQIAIHKLSREAKKQGGLSPQLLAQHVIANQENEDVVQALVMAGQGALRYEFFGELTAAIEAAEKQGDNTTAQRLSQYRADFLEIHEEMQNASRQVLDEAVQTLQLLLDAPDKATAVRQHADKLDEAFMYVLSARMAEAEQKGHQADFAALNEIQEAIIGLVEDQMPPEIQLINHLVQAESPAQQAAILDANRQMLSPELVAMIDQIMTQSTAAGQPELNDRLQAIKAAIQSRLVRQ
ncbi:MAG TPA: CpXC domain-containing protein [Chloroflexota bacterium]|nr:CpXC domain-containing protein [Chloroflexota bacterium]